MTVEERQKKGRVREIQRRKLMNEKDIRLMISDLLVPCPHAYYLYFKR
jgi:hypothetical protein